jgi:DNA-directed RNA polymerase specialized sigma24 family protein
MIRAIAGGDFESEWRAVAPSLDRVLTRRGVPAGMREDVMQETALRLYRSWERVDPDRPLLPLAVTIANNIVWDTRNHRSNVEVPGVVPDLPTNQDVEDSGIARLELRRVKDAMGRMSAPHRRVLLAEVGAAEAPEGSRDATKMLRLRARKKMRMLLDAASASAGIVGVRKGLWKVLRGSRRPAMSAGAPMAAATACGIVALLIVPGTGSIAGDPFKTAVAPSGVALERVVASDDLRSAPASAPKVSSGRSDRSPSIAKSAHADPPAGSYWEIGVGDDGGPVGGDAEFGITTDPGGVSKPECSVDRPSDHQVGAACRVDAGDQRLEVHAEVELRPTP